MIGGLRNTAGHVEEEDPEREQDDDSYLHFLSGRAEEDREQQNGRHDAG